MDLVLSIGGSGEGAVRREDWCKHVGLLTAEWSAPQPCSPRDKSDSATDKSQEAARVCRSKVLQAKWQALGILNCFPKLV